MSGRRAGTARGTRPRPRRAFGPIFSSLFGLAAWAAVAHNSGSGWVQALGALLAGFLAVGLLAPALAVMRARVVVVANQADAFATTPSQMEVRTNAPLAVTALTPPGPTVLVHPGQHGTATIVANHRGELTAVRFQLASAAPFGILWWTKIVTVDLPRTLIVSPKVGLPDPVLRQAADNVGEQTGRVDARVGEPRGVRTYQSGDLRHWVHWPATAHAGKLMVREMEAPRSSPVVIEVALPSDLDHAERVAERYLGTVAELLSQGRTVVLVTDEVTGRHGELVTTVTDTGRRLARTLPLRDLGRRP
jgi:uncharacterized protein (DUF58 family)